MKLLLDEMLSPAIARELRARGHDVEAIAGHPNREALTDPEVIAVARAEHRAIVTNNLRDYRPLHSDAIIPGGTGHYGMIFLPGPYRRSKNDARMFENSFLHGRCADVLPTSDDQIRDSADDA